MPSPFRVKICGITRPEDALAALQAGADALGLNFFPGSKRFVSRTQAKAITTAVRTRFDPALNQSLLPNQAVTLVGVFVNSTVDEILQTVTEVGLDSIQLHGDESPAAVQHLSEILLSLPREENAAPVQLLRAYRCQGQDLTQIAAQAQACCLSSGLSPFAALLLDAYQPGAYGGTGEVVDWKMVHQQRSLLHDWPVILAGGLTAGNVAEAISTAAPDGVDVAGGVEISPGIKDHIQMQAFVAAAKSAFGS